MNIQMQFNLSQLTQIQQSLQSNKDSIQDKSLLKIIERIDKQLNGLNILSKMGFTILTETFKDDTLVVLSELHKDLQIFDKKNDRVKQVRDRILQIRTDLETTKINHKEIAKAKIGLKIGFYCDIDCPDKNNAITPFIYKALEQDFPFITTRSLLRHEGRDEDKQHLEIQMIEKVLIKNKDRWEIYQRSDPEGNDFLVFLPKSLLPGKLGIEKLKSLDFISDGTLKQITFAEAFRSSTGKNRFEAFSRLFSKNPELQKMFILAGHGDNNLVGALEGSNYTKFRHFLEEQNCKALVVHSCYSGGASVLMPEENGQILNSSYPVFVISIGDFISYTGLKLDQYNKELLESVGEYYEKPGSETVHRLKTVFEKFERFSGKGLENYVKVLTPGSQDLPLSFRSIGEHNESEALTYRKVKQHELLVASRDLPAEKVVKNKMGLEVYPLITDIPLVFENHNPTLVSMIPGNGHHFIQSLKLARENPNEFINKTIDFHNSKLVNVSKGFFIGNVRGKDTNFQQVVLNLNRFKSMAVYKDGNKYFLKQDKEIKEITFLQYRLLGLSIIADTCPTANALRTASAGQESEEDFVKKINEAPFYIQSISNKTILRLLSVGKLNDQEKIDLIFYLIHQGSNKLALRLLKEHKINPNGKSIQKTPLIYAAVKCKDPQMLEFLLQSGADPAAVNYDNGKSALHLSVEQGNPKVLEQLIALPKVNIEVEDLEGWTSFFYALENPALRNLFLAKSAKFNYLDHKSGRTPLEEAIVSEKSATVQALLELGADIELGDHSALFYAIQKRNIDLVRKLLDKGAKPFQVDSRGFVPAVEAMFRVPSELVKLLITRDDVDPNLLDAHGYTPFTAALLMGDQEIIEILLSKGAKIPDNLSLENNELLKTVVMRYIKTDRDALRTLLASRKCSSPGFEALVTGTLIQNSEIPLLTDLISAGSIKPNSKGGQKTVFEGVFDFYLNNITDKNKALLEACLKQGVDFTRFDSISSGIPLKRAIASLNPAVVKLLINYGAEIAQITDLRDSFNKVIKMGDLELIKIFHKNGAQIEPEDDYLMSPLEVAVGILQFRKVSDIDPIIRWLIENGADLNRLNHLNSNAFCEVIRTNHLPLIEFCLANKAKMNVEDGRITSPIFNAVEVKKLDLSILKKLVQAGGDLNEPGKREYVTPFALLVSSASLEVVQWAYELGKAEVNPKNPDKKLTPLQATYNRPDADGKKIYKKLIAWGAVE